MKGQGIIEYALFLILVAVVVIVLVLVLSGSNSACFMDKTSFACKNQRVEECLKSEQYTREECIALIGGGSTK